MLTALIAVAVVLLAAGAAEAQRTTRRGGKPAQEQSHAHARGHNDSTACVRCDSTVRISGYDKTLQASKESFFVTNLMDSASITRLHLTLSYSDIGGRSLHKRSIDVDCHIPCAETRRIDIPSWDRQHVYFYRLSEPRRRVTAAAAPYDVAIAADSVVVSIP